MSSITDSLYSLRGSAEDLLCRMIEFNSTAGNEAGVQEFLYGFLSRNGFSPEYAPISDDIQNDPDFTNVPPHKPYAGRHNIVLNIPGWGGGRSLIINSHSDVVPGPEELFQPKCVDGIVYGRGACDAKGQVLTIILAVLALKKAGIKLKGDLQAQIVIEEETGGNGSLSLLAQGHRADAAVVLEPTGLKIHPANRGAVWFKLVMNGKSVHMGQYWNGVSAVKEMMGLIGILNEYEAFLQKESEGNPLFPFHPSPVNVNIGMISGGNWPSTVPGHCEIEGGIAFLPNRRISDIYAEVKSFIEGKAGAWAKEHYSFEFTRLHNEAFETPIDNPAVKTFFAAAEPVIGRQVPSGWVASCDARLFYHRGGMPTIVFGAGSLEHAHSLTEQIKMDDIMAAADVLLRFICEWCGASEERGVTNGKI